MMTPYRVVVVILVIVVAVVIVSDIGGCSAGVLVLGTFGRVMLEEQFDDMLVAVVDGGMERVSSKL